jgi:hypothetical protein
MSQFEEAVARLTQARSKLAPIRERLLIIEARLAVAKAADIEWPAKFSLREGLSALRGTGRSDAFDLRWTSPPSH